MKSKVKEIWKIAQGLILLFILFLLFVAALKYIIQIINDGLEHLLQIVSKADVVIIVALITGTLSILGVVLSSIIAKVVEYRQKTKRNLFEKRVNIFKKLNISKKANCQPRGNLSFRWTEVWFNIN